MDKIIQRTGLKKGLTSIILVGIHGDETCGVKALHKLLPHLAIERGKVFFGYGNPKAIKKHQRYTETNLNRMFNDERTFSIQEQKSYEYKRAQFLKKYFHQTDALLDIHASFTPQSKPFIICEQNAKKIIPHFPIDLVVSGFDNVEPGGTDYYMNHMRKIGICVECGYLDDPQSTLIAEESILTFLKVREHIHYDTHQKKQSYIKIYALYLTKTNIFRLAKPFEDFEILSKGQYIGMDGRKKIHAQKKCVILFARDRNKIGDEAFLLGEKKKSLA